jgi:hypothetical protein
MGGNVLTAVRLTEATFTVVRLTEYSTPCPLFCWRCSTATATAVAMAAPASGPDSPTATKVDVGGPDRPPLLVPGAAARFPSPPRDPAARAPVPLRRSAARLTPPPLSSPALAPLFHRVWICRGPLV